MKRINRIIEFLEQDQPVYYVSTDELTYENGLELSKAWADYIRLDLNHGPYDIMGVRNFMKGLVAGGPTKTGHRTMPVIVELPTDGTNEMVVRANSWMIKQLLACGVHGLLLCHAENPEAVRAFVEASRFGFQTIGVGNYLDVGRRGSHTQTFAADIWGVSVDEYVHKADVWPLNPNGEIILGIKMENKRALANAPLTSKVPGICFGEWGLADMSMVHGYPKKPDFPLPEELQKIKDYVWDICKKAGIYFLCIVTEDDICKQIDNGLRFCRAYDPKIAEIGRRYTKRTIPW